MSPLNLGSDIKEGCAGDVSPRLLFAPRQGMRPCIDGGAHQIMPCRVKRDFVDALTAPVMRMQHGRHRIGIEAPLNGLFAPRNFCKCCNMIYYHKSAFASHALDERHVLLKQVVVDERRNLVEHLVSNMTESSFHIKGHRCSNLSFDDALSLQDT